MAMRPQGLIPGMQDHGAPTLPAEAAVPTLPERLTRRVAQQGQQRSLVRQDARVEVVWYGKHQVERGPRQPRGLAVLHPLALGTGLALRAVTMATGMIRVSLKPTGGPVCGVPPALRSTAGFKVTHHPLLGGRHEMGTAVRLARETEEIGDCPRWGPGRAQGGRPWAVGGMGWHGVPPAWAGVGPRRVGGQTGCGGSPEAAG